MGILEATRKQYAMIVQPNEKTTKAISHHPDLADRQHIYAGTGQSEGQSYPSGDSYTDYATVYQVYTWVQKAISRTSDQLKHLPVQVVSASDDKPIAKHPVSEAFANPNDSMTNADMWNEWVVSLSLGGECFTEIDQSEGQMQLWTHRPDMVDVRKDERDTRRPRAAGYDIRYEDGTSAFVDYQHCIHNAYYNPLSSWRGLAPIAAARNGITVGLLAQNWSKLFLKNNARPDFAIIAPQGLTTTERDRYLASFFARHRGNPHEPVILEEGITDIKPFSFAPKDLEWMQQQEYSRSEVAALFGVPDEIMGYGRDTYQNFETAMKVFWSLTIKPLIDWRDSDLNKFFTYSLPMLKPGQVIKTDVSSIGVLQEDKRPKAELAKIYYSMGVPFNRLDEVMNLGIGPIDGGDMAGNASPFAGQPGQPGQPAQLTPPGQPVQPVKGAATEQPFFTWPKALTPESVKALKVLVLQLDPDGGDEAEQHIRMELERRSARAIDKAFTDMVNTLYPEGYGSQGWFVDPNVEAVRIHRAFVEDQALRDAVSRALLDGVDLGVSLTVAGLENVGIGFDYLLAHTAARDWAIRYTDTLLEQMGVTSGKLAGQSVARWFENGEPLSQLITDLEPVFGRKRAERIAATEVTRAAAQGTVEAGIQSGVIDYQPSIRPPEDTHVNCRCWLTIAIDDKNKGHWMFRNSNDEKVCPICAPLGGRWV